MLTKLRVGAANCPVCFNDVIERLRGLDGVNSVDSSIGEGCLAVDHDELTESDLSPG